MQRFGLIDNIIKEPEGGAHSNPENMARTVKRYIKKTTEELLALKPQERINSRIEKFSEMGFYEENLSE